jgi:hypothetical protein
MAKTKISEYSTTAGSNTDIDSTDINEGCAPSGINNAIRSLMAHLAVDYTSTQAYTTTATAAGTTTLTASSTLLQFFTGSTTQTVVLPVVTTLTTGQRYEIHNNSSGAITVNSSGGNLVATVPAGITTVCTCILITGTTAASWDADIQGFTSTVPVAQGGTGAATLTGVIKGNGTSAFTAATAGTDYAGIDTAQTFTKGQRGEITVLTDGATITPDLADSNNYSVTLGGNRTLANPTNTTAGQSGSIFVSQDGTGSRTLAYGTNWDFAGGTAPTLSTAASSIDRIDYVVRTATSIHAVFTANYS